MPTPAGNLRWATALTGAAGQFPVSVQQNFQNDVQRQQLHLQGRQQNLAESAQGAQNYYSAQQENRLRAQLAQDMQQFQQTHRLNWAQLDQKQQEAAVDAVIRNRTNDLTDTGQRLDYYKWGWGQYLENKRQQFTEGRADQRTVWAADATAKQAYLGFLRDEWLQGRGDKEAMHRELTRLEGNRANDIAQAWDQMAIEREKQAGEERKYGREVDLGNQLYQGVQPGEQVTMGGVTINRSRPPEPKATAQDQRREMVARAYFNDPNTRARAQQQGIDPWTYANSMADWYLSQSEGPKPQSATAKAPMSWSQAYDYAKQYGLSNNLRGPQLETMARDYANRLTGQQVQEPGTQPSAAAPARGYAMPAGPGGETQVSQQSAPPQGWGRDWQEAKAMAWRVAKQKIPDLTPQQFEQNWQQDGPMVVIQDLQGMQ